MKRVFGGIVIALAVMALAGFIAAQARNSQASETPPTQATNADAASAALGGGANTQQAAPDLKANAQSQKPFIGIVLAELSDEEAAELGIEGGAAVRNVLEGGPSAGVLAEGDVITSINGQAVENASDVIEIVGGVEPGAVLEVAILRDGAAQTVSITVGERPLPVPPFQRHGQLPRDIDPIFAHLRALADRLVRAEVVLETDDGFITYQAVAGTVKEEVPEGSLSFTLVSKDGQEFAYTIDEETMVMMRQDGSLDGLNTTDPTYVLSVVEEDGTQRVKAVLQGEFPHGFMQHRGGPKIFVAPQFRGGNGRPEGLNELRERLQRSGVPFTFQFDNNGRNFEFNLDELLQDLPFDLDDLEDMDEDEIEDAIGDRIRLLRQ